MMLFIFYQNVFQLSRFLQEQYSCNNKQGIRTAVQTGNHLVQHIWFWNQTCCSDTLLLGVSTVAIRWLGVWRVSAPKETHPRAQSNEWRIILSIMVFVLVSAGCLNSNTWIISTKGWGSSLSVGLALFYAAQLPLFCFPHIVCFAFRSLGKKKEQKLLFFFVLRCRETE